MYFKKLNDNKTTNTLEIIPLESPFTPAKIRLGKHVKKFLGENSPKVHLLLTQAKILLGKDVKEVHVTCVITF